MDLNIVIMAKNGLFAHSHHALWGTCGANTPDRFRPFPTVSDRFRPFPTVSDRQPQQGFLKSWTPLPLGGRGGEGGARVPLAGTPLPPREKGSENGKCLPGAEGTKENFPHIFGAAGAQDKNLALKSALPRAPPPRGRGTTSMPAGYRPGPPSPQSL